MSNPKLIINPIGGLANRMRALASGLALAYELQCDYSIVWCRNWEIKARLDDIFSIPAELESKTCYPSSLVYNLLYMSPRKKNLFLSAPIGRMAFGLILRDAEQPLKSMVRDNDHYGIADLCKTALADGKEVLFQGGINMYPFSTDQYINLFTPTEDIRRKVNSVLQRLGNKSIGLHIRRSDNLQSILHSPDSLFIAKMDEILATEPATTFYLATDDEPTKVKFRNLYGNKVIVSDSRADRGSVKGIVDAATELFILSSTDIILGSHYSSFSEAAATIGRKSLLQLYQ